MKKLFRTKWFKYIVLLFSLGLITGIGYYYYSTQQPTSGILEFNQLRDAQFIKDIFTKDWYWLVSEYSYDFSPDYMLKYRASSKKLQHKGNLSIKVYYENNEPIGFITYYMKKFYYGYILFLDIIPELRGKGYAYKLVTYAINDLIARGAKKIGLVTRTTNYPAQKLYNRFGFKETHCDEGFVDFEYTIES